jgi:hypothetical protein
MHGSPAGRHLFNAVIGVMSDMPRRKPISDLVTPRLADRINLLVPQDIDVSGWLGSRIASNGQRYREQSVPKLYLRQRFTTEWAMASTHGEATAATSLRDVMHP